MAAGNGKQRTRKAAVKAKQVAYVKPKKQQVPKVKSTTTVKNTKKPDQIKAGTEDKSDRKRDEKGRFA